LIGLRFHTDGNEGNKDVDQKNARTSRKQTPWIGRTILALFLGVITFTVALLLLPASLSYLSIHADLESGDEDHRRVDDRQIWPGDDHNNQRSVIDSIALIEQAVPGIVEGSRRLPVTDKFGNTGGWQPEPDMSKRTASAIFRTDVDQRRGFSGGVAPAGDSFIDENFLSTSGRVQLAQAVVTASGNDSEGRPTATQTSDPANAQASSAPEPSVESDRNDKPAPQSVVEVRNKATFALAKLLDSGFYAGYESDYLWLLNKPSLGLQVNQHGQGALSISPADSYGPGGRVYFGMRAAERGIRATYSFYHGENQSDSGIGGMTPILSRALSDHHLQTFDIEVTQPFRLGGVDLEVTAGARHLQYQSSDSIFVLAEPTSALHGLGAASATNDLSALGFTGSMHGRHVLPSVVFGEMMPFLHDECDVSGCYTQRSFWYWDVRASALWGESKAAALTNAAVTVNDQSGMVGFAASRDFAMATNASESMLTSLELQLGIEHRRRWYLFPNADLVFRSGIEFRRFSLGRSRATTQSFAFLEDADDTFGLRIDAHSRTQDNVLRMFGLVFAVGTNF